HEFTIQIVDVPPALSSSTNPNQGSYTTNNAVVMAWKGGNPGQGYYYLFDDYPDTRPTNLTGTYEATTQSPAQVLLSNVSPGRWFFHMIAYDSMGYPTHGASHYEVDIGTAPTAATSGTVAGTVLDGTGTGIVGATVVVQRGLYQVQTQAGGVYTFGNSAIPAGTYEVVAEASGMQSQSLTLTVTGGATTDGDFTLTPGTGCPSCGDPCSGIACPNTVAQTCSLMSGVGWAQEAPLPWMATCEAGSCSLEFAPVQTICPYTCNGNACWTTCVSSGNNCNPSGQPCCGTSCTYYPDYGYYCP
ncbi:MAG TPA: carboxypeptidase-like regulatory domain-containing protein, partial [Myxococcales bacterium]|nr:carboxypeptidase-like regulatory domain-containing protein [Myxococcales bacterium]